jgi:hypothetical protein
LCDIGLGLEEMNLSGWPHNLRHYKPHDTEVGANIEGGVSLAQDSRHDIRDAWICVSPKVHGRPVVLISEDESLSAAAELRNHWALTTDE